MYYRLWGWHTQTGGLSDAPEVHLGRPAGLTGGLSPCRHPGVTTLCRMLEKFQITQASLPDLTRIKRPVPSEYSQTYDKEQSWVTSDPCGNDVHDHHCRVHVRRDLNMSGGKICPQSRQKSAALNTVRTFPEILSEKVDVIRLQGPTALAENF
ncbi:hypothetical protein Bbelb_295450 [Branchiostoma belcheri]|nr:hypothetical protein Bbelb_295450 [Branchiostoma belcheri]